MLLPVLPLRDIVFFPEDCVPLFVGRKKSLNAVTEAHDKGKKLFLITQKNASLEEPALDDLHQIGVIASVLQLIKSLDGAVKVLIKVDHRAQLKELDTTNLDFLQGYVSIVEDEHADYSTTDIEALKRSTIKSFENCAKLSKKIPIDVLNSIQNTQSAGRIADLTISHLDIKVVDKQKILETLNIYKRLEAAFKLIESEVVIIKAERRISNAFNDQVEKKQRLYYLNEKLQAILKELGENEGVVEYNEIQDLEKKISSLTLSSEAKDKLNNEVKKLKLMNQMSSEATVVRNYIEWVLSLPWNVKTPVKSDLNFAEKILDQNHYGMEKVKERIVEHLAVQKMRLRSKSPSSNKRAKLVAKGAEEGKEGTILCLYGPPGVGKTSLAKSIADATGRNFVRMSLGGVRDESEIRGHRRTYIGAMPGKIMQHMKKAKSSNPLFLLDEIDKMGSDFRGDPAFALLEVLDPDHNKHFVDHYIEVEYDLSDVMFVATANTLNMPAPLLDRMELIRVDGYSEDEKIKIATLHLVESLKKEHGLKSNEWNISAEALKELIRRYTRESGVRSLSKELSNLMRKSIKEILLEKSDKVIINLNNLRKYAGVPKYTFGVVEEENSIGMTRGLAYTESGGELLTIEAVINIGKGNIKGTGKLGTVMQESIQAAHSYVGSKCIEYGITTKHYKRCDIHLHVPEGATPKDGPSAGVAICTSIISVLTGIPVKAEVAMTGEVTLRGRVLEIGGLKEKLLAALRGGIKTVIIPARNEKDLVKIPLHVKKNLDIIPVSTVEEVIKIALAKPVSRLETDDFPDQEDKK